MARSRWFAAAMVVLFAASGCTTAWRANFIAPAKYGSIPMDQPFVKAHTTDGHVYVLEQWSVDEDARLVTGRGLLYDPQRKLKQSAQFSIAFDQISLIETNQPQEFMLGGLQVLGVMTGLTAVGAAVCLANPKACFGSCPTFYARQDGRIVAEGFSRSVARTLEETDLDQLPLDLAAGPDGTLSLWMKNEAYETHVVRHVRLLSFPVGEGEQIIRTPDRFFRIRGMSAPTTCAANGVDCASLVAAEDGRQYLSLTDPNDLAAEETVALTFPSTSGTRKGLLLRARNSLVETHAFYQLMAYLGGRADDWFLQLEKAGVHGKRLVEQVIGPLGTIDVEVATVYGWRRVGTFNEVGPLAWDEVVIPFDHALPPGPVSIRIKMAQGSWKVDQLALVELGAEAVPQVVDPSAVLRRGKAHSEAAAKLGKDGDALVTYPGEAYELRFQPPSGRQQFFLETRGYYYEWIRDSWLREQDEVAFDDAVWNPSAFLRKIAPDYKAMEATAEQTFWESRVDAQ